MTQDRDCQQTLTNKVLPDMIAQARLLARITLEEGLALRDANLDVLNDKVQSKQQIVKLLTLLDSQFRDLLSKLGFPKDKDIASFFNEALHSADLVDLWNEYVKLMQDCDKQNRENSVLVNVGLRHTKQALQFLRSCIGEQEETLYGPHYIQQSSSANNNSIIAKA